MKKVILNLAFASLSLFTFSAMAHQPSCGQSCGNSCDSTKCENVGNHNQCGQHNNACDRPQRPAISCPFEGIELTDAQKEQLKAIMPKCERNTTQHQAMPAACPDFLAKIKEILTPEQYVQFLENTIKNQPRHQRGPRHHQPRRAHHGQCGQQPQGCREMPQGGCPSGNK